jgi:chaperonin cofactor prefoldin
MTIAEQQMYNAWYKSLGNKIYDWHEAKPENKDLINLLKAVEVVGIYTNKLETENRHLKAELDVLKNEIQSKVNSIKELL